MKKNWRKHQFTSVTQSCLTLCGPMDCSTPGFPVHHQLLELAQTHVHQVGDAIELSHPLLSPSPPTFNLSQCQGLFHFSATQYFASGGQSIVASASASVLPMTIQDWFPLELTGLIPGPASYLLWYNWIFLVSPLRVNTSRCFFRTRLWPYSHCPGVNICTVESLTSSRVCLQPNI